MVGLDGIAVLNIVSNPKEAEVSGRKALQTRITHNDGALPQSPSAVSRASLTSRARLTGGTWKPMTPPALDSLKQPYACTTTVRPSTARAPQAPSSDCPPPSLLCSGLRASHPRIQRASGSQGDLQLALGRRPDDGRRQRRREPRCLHVRSCPSLSVRLARC